MRINGIRCDACGKEHHFAPRFIFQSYVDVLPDGWFIVSRAPYKPDVEPWIFCSEDCLHNHSFTTSPNSKQETYQVIDIRKH